MRQAGHKPPPRNSRAALAKAAREEKRMKSVKEIVAAALSRRQRAIPECVCCPRIVNYDPRTGDYADIHWEVPLPGGCPVHEAHGPHRRTD